MFRTPVPQTLKADHTSRVSRCAVCIRRQITEDTRLKPQNSNGHRYPPSNINDRNPEYDRVPEWQRPRNPGVNRGGRPPYNRVPGQFRRKGRTRKPEIASN